MTKPIASFRIDAEDRVIDCNGDLSPYCSIHGGTLLGFSPDLDIGSPWLSNVPSDSLRLYLRLLATAVRATGTPFRYPYCGEVNGIHYQFEFHLSLLFQGDIAVDHFLIGTRQTATPYPLTAAPAEHALLRCCTLCSRVNDGYGWRERAQVFAAWPQTPGTEIPAIFSVCWDCSEDLGPRVSALFQRGMENTARGLPEKAAA